MATPQVLVHFGEWEQHPIRWTNSEAWMLTLTDYTWKEMNSADAIELGFPLSKEEFAHRFRNLTIPKLPKQAFKGIDVEQ